MDLFEYGIYWLIFSVLAVIVIVSGIITATAIALVVLWQKLFDSEVRLESCPLCPHNDG